MARQTRDHLDFDMSFDELLLKLNQLEIRISTLEFREKEFRPIKDRLLATLESRCQLLCELTKLINDGLHERVTTLKAIFQSKFKQAVGAEVELRLRQMKELATMRGNVDVSEIENRAGRNPNHQNVVDNMKRMEIELRCGICSELMVSATSLNCMHTFCQYCISQWKHFESTREAEAGCPVCRQPTTLEKRNYFADNLIEIMVDCYSEEEKNSRKELVAHLQELTQNLFGSGTRPETNSSSQARNHTDQLMREIEMQIEDIFQFLGKGSVDHYVDAVNSLARPTLPHVPVPPPQPTLPARLPSNLVAAVIPVQRTSSSQTSETETNPFALLVSNQQRIRENAQRGRQSNPVRPAILGILGPRAIQRAANRTNQSSARPAAGRKLQGMLSKPRWRY